MHRKIVIGVMGGAKENRCSLDVAFKLGVLIADAGWILLNGGRDTGVMNAAARGARSRGGLTVGILPGRDRSGISLAVDIAILTGMGDARNCINVLSSDVVIACTGGLGTLSEVALALKNERTVILLGFEGRGPVLAPWERRGRLLRAATPGEAICLVREVLRASSRTGEPTARESGEEE